MTDSGTDTASSLATEDLLPPVDMDLWGLNAVLYSAGPPALCAVREDACRAWAADNHLTVVGACRDQELGCSLSAMERPGVIHALDTLALRDGDVLAVDIEVFEEFSVGGRAWLRRRVTEHMCKRLELVPKTVSGSAQ